MDIASTHKKNMHRLMSFFAVLILCVAMCSCDGKAGRYPHDLGTEWICNDPYFSLKYTEDANGILVQTEQLEWEGETIAVDVGFISTTYCVYPEHSNHYEDRLFSGTWSYRNKVLILSIDEDFIFDNQYSELIFSLTCSE